MNTKINLNQASREKNNAALSSVIAAVGLTMLKLVVGITTNSLGILAEAAHSGLDLVAAIITLIAVRISDRPADGNHRYGHGKVENLSALFETLLLFATCVWIIFESVQRLFFRPAEIDPSIWAFLVMGLSIGVDVSRSRILFRAARKHNSQALEADALHFSTDIWSSSVVILGLVGVILAKTFPGLAFLKQADAVAALIVAAIVVYISFKLGKRTIMALLDTAPPGIIEKLKAVVQGTPKVRNCHRIRVRPSGAHYFVDVHILVDSKARIEEVHAITEAVEQAVHRELPGADVTVHPEPDTPANRPTSSEL
ncbi:MAG: cation diffusion facilitator family transporter [Caldiserica bacterium]|nr:cation diffusion facilitator family transporter [Caldisericota bacterium]MDH7562491.1 cation diffusion facilitator family transporter [Caldisericota bacterium]